MSRLPLAARVVEVIADLGESVHPRYRFGSGCVVAGRTVLTAAHVVTGAAGVLVRDVGKVIHEAAIDPEFVGDVNGPGPDLALVTITGPWTEIATMGLAAVDRDSPSGDPVERCHVVGYPAFMERDAADGGRFRETADAFGQLPVLSGLAGGLLSVQVSSAPRPLPPARTALGESEWSGMSGGPVVADGLLLGVVTEHAPRAGTSTITATPVTALEVDPGHPGWGPGVRDPAAWWARLGVSGSPTLPRLPVPPTRTEPAYWATLREVHQRTKVLVGREKELAAIASFATGSDGYRWLTGGAWAGKTALLAEAVVRLRGECDVVCYFLSRREGDADSSRFLAAVVPQLTYLLEEDPPIAELHQFRALWQRAVQRADAEDRHLLLVVDGLDEDLRPPGLLSVAALLPPRAGGRVHVLVSSRPYPGLPSDPPSGHPLTQARPTQLQPFAGALELAALARQEIDDLLRRDDDGLATDVLGLLTAAAGPLAVADLAAMTAVSQSAALTRRIRQLVKAAAARSLQVADSTGDRGYQFAHESLLQYAQANDDLNDPEFLGRIHQWAARWQAAGWPVAADDGEGTPRYLVDTYPSALTRDPRRLAALVTDVGWIDTAIRSVGVDRILADLRRAAAANPGDATVAAVLGVIRGQAHYLRPPQPVAQPGFVLRQLCMYAAELSEDELAKDLRGRLRSRPGPCLVPQWTTRRASSALSAELGRHGVGLRTVRAVAVLPDGRVVTVGDDAQVLVWDPAAPGAAAQLGRADDELTVVAALPDERVVTGSRDGRVLVWDPADPGADPVELGRHEGDVEALAVLPDGRVVTGGHDGRVLMWDRSAPSVGPAELSRFPPGGYQAVDAVAVLPDGQVVTAGGGLDNRMRICDPDAPGARSVERRRDSGIQALAVLPDGRVVTGESDGRVLVLDLADPGADPVELGRHSRGVMAVAVLPDWRVVTGGQDLRVLVWDLADPGAGPVELGRHDGVVIAVAVLPDGRVITAGVDGRILVWDPAVAGRGTAGLTNSHDGAVRALAFLPDGRLVTGGDDGRVLVWDQSAPGAGPVELGRRNYGVWTLAVLPDGRVVTGGDKTWVPVWDPDAPGYPDLVGRHDSDTMATREVAALPDGRVVTGGGSPDARVLVWDPATPFAPVELGWHDGGVMAVGVLPDGRVVTGGGDERVLLWDPAAPGAAPVELGRHQGWVRAVAVLLGGRVVTGGDDGWVLAWDPAAPGYTDLVGRHSEGLAAVAALPDGRVVTGGWDQRVVVWGPDQASVVQLACSAIALAAAPLGPEVSLLAIAHQGTGFSVWSITK